MPFMRGMAEKYPGETEKLPKAVEGTDGSIRVVIPSDIADSYAIKDKDKIAFFVNGKGTKAEVGDLVLKVTHRGEPEWDIIP